METSTKTKLRKFIINFKTILTQFLASFFIFTTRPTCEPNLQRLNKQPEACIFPSKVKTRDLSSSSGRETRLLVRCCRREDTLILSALRLINKSSKIIPRKDAKNKPSRKAECNLICFASRVVSLRPCVDDLKSSNFFLCTAISSKRWSYAQKPQKL